MQDETTSADEYQFLLCIVANSPMLIAALFEKKGITFLKEATTSMSAGSQAICTTNIY